MHLSYDRETDAEYIYVREPGDRKGTVESIPVDDAPGVVVVDFDTDGCLFGIEVLDASRFLPAELLVERPPLTDDADINTIWSRVIDAVHDIAERKRASVEAAREVERPPLHQGLEDHMGAPTVRRSGSWVGLRPESTE